jgi:hypothetical protein
MRSSVAKWLISGCVVMLVYPSPTVKRDTTELPAARVAAETCTKLTAAFGAARH